jgi:hypothetical protein
MIWSRFSQNQGPIMAVPEWPEEWTSRPMVVLDDHMAQHVHGAGYGLTYGGPSEPMPFEEWERDPSNALAMEFMPSFVDAYGFKRVLSEHIRAYSRCSFALDLKKVNSLQVVAKQPATYVHTSQKKTIFSQVAGNGYRVH